MTQKRFDKWELISKLLNLAGFEFNAAVRLVNYQPNEARRIIARIEREFVESVAAGT